jgi:hypothetical protein
LASNHVATVAGQRGQDERLLTEGVGAKFSDHVVSLADKSDEQLKSIAHTAKRTGQNDLVRAAAQTALDRNLFEVYRQWSQDDPERAQALERLRSTPDVEQLATRTEAMKPPVAFPESLTPTFSEKEEHARREERKRQDAERRRQEFYRNPPPRRQVGRYMT